MLLLPDYRVRQRDFLLEISRALTSQLNLDEVLRLILEAAASMLAGDVGLIALREDDRNFYTRATFGVSPEQIELFEPLLQGITTDDSEDGLNIEELDNKVRLVARRLDMRLRQVVQLPMVMQGEIVGVIFIFRTYRGQSTTNDRIVLQSFADQAAIAVNNARLYQSVRREQQRLKAILDHSADGVMILDSAQRILHFNKALGRMAGWYPADAIGQMHDTVIVWDHIDQGKPLGRAVADGWPNQNPNNSSPALYVEGDLKRPDGTSISLGVTYAPLIDQDGRLRNIIVNVRDITHFRQAEEMKSTFISIISHELKTPVALIKGYAGTLRREDAEWDRATIQNGLTVIEEEADRLTELIDNLLAASKMQADGLRLTNLSDVNLRIVAERSAERFKTQTKTHTLALDFPDDFPIIHGDETRLRQVIDNLVSNAIKYSPKGGEVRITGTFDDQIVTIEVSDQGVGLPEDELDRIFERFYRVEGALSRKTQGTGLGLYLARAVVEAHGGQIFVESKPGKGSTFRFTLPRESTPATKPTSTTSERQAKSVSA
jgi:PAS domain S-box-containing protein